VHELRAEREAAAAQMTGELLESAKPTHEQELTKQKGVQCHCDHVQMKISEKQEY
jgi:hypothetical protein